MLKLRWIKHYQEAYIELIYEVIEGVVTSLIPKEKGEGSLEKQKDLGTSPTFYYSISHDTSYTCNIGFD